MDLEIFITLFRLDKNFTDSQGEISCDDTVSDRFLL